MILYRNNFPFKPSMQSEVFFAHYLCKLEVFCLCNTLFGSHNMHENSFWQSVQFFFVQVYLQVIFSKSSNPPPSPCPKKRSSGPSLEGNDSGHWPEFG